MLIDEVRSCADKFRDKIIVAGLSGGADSVCLVHALKTSGFNVVAAHVNHCLRGMESDRDEQFVRDFCDRYDIPLFAVRVDVASLAELNHTGLEDEGRRVRYEFFESVPVHNKIIATAHNKNDAAETVLIHLLRGSGGLKGMGHRDGVIRPLINVTRSEIEDYCRENSLSFCADSSNLSEDYTRNKIRLSVMPILREINPSVDDALLRAAEVSRLDRQAAELFADLVNAEKQGDRWFVSTCDMPDGVLYRVIRRLYAREYGSDRNLSFENVRAAANLAKSGKTGKVAMLGSGICLETAYGGFLIGRLPETHAFCREIQGETFFSESSLVVTAKVSKSPSGKISLDADKTGRIFGRSRKNGDRLSVGGHTKKLKDILIDKKIPVRQRDKLVVIDSDYGVVGVVGIGFDKKYFADDKTVKFLNIDWREYNE